MPSLLPNPHPLHIEILLTRATPLPQPSPQLSMLHTTIEVKLQKIPLHTQTLSLSPTLSDLTLPTSEGEVAITQIRLVLSEDDAKLTLPLWRVRPITYLYAHRECMSEVQPPAGASITPIPCMEYARTWENLHFDSPIKSTLMNYITTRHSYPFLRSSGFMLLYGPPGTGKTSLAEGVAHKVGIRQGHGWMVRLRASVLSKYFGESANRLEGVFAWIRARSPEESVVIVVDEIETFGMVREVGNCSGGDGIRVTNALITGLDSVRGMRKVVVIGTSNMGDGIDEAIRDRADICLAVGGIGGLARGRVLQGLLEGLEERGVLNGVGDVEEVVELFQGLSGRRLEAVLMVAVGLATGGVGTGGVAWERFTLALGEAVRICGGKDGLGCGNSVVE